MAVGHGATVMSRKRATSEVTVHISILLQECMVMSSLLIIVMMSLLLILMMSLLLMMMILLLLMATISSCTFASQVPVFDHLQLCKKSIFWGIYMQPKTGSRDEAK